MEKDYRNDYSFNDDTLKREHLLPRPPEQFLNRFSRLILLLAFHTVQIIKVKSQWWIISIINLLQKINHLEVRYLSLPS